MITSRAKASYSTAIGRITFLFHPARTAFIGNRRATISGAALHRLLMKSWKEANNPKDKTTVSSLRNNDCIEALVGSLGPAISIRTRPKANLET